jgi:hypothetical protein
MVVASVALIVALGGSAYAVTNFVGPNGQIHGCVGSKGRLSLLKPGKKCSTDKSPIAWNKGAKFDPADFQRSHAKAGGALAGTYPAPRLKPSEPWNEVGDGDGPLFDLPEGCASFVTGPVFENYGQGFTTAAFYRDPLGVVHVKGLVRPRSDTNCHTVFTLPAGYRPAQQEIHPGVSYESNQTNPDYMSARIDVTPAGAVVVQHFGRDYVSLDGVTFRCAPAGASGCP